jgi:hypothetical protein
VAEKGQLLIINGADSMALTTGSAFNVLPAPDGKGQLPFP